MLFRQHGKFFVIIQGLYFLITGAWPLVNMNTFFAVTGPKTEIWLVKCIGLLIVAIGFVLLLSALNRRIVPETIILAIASSLALAGIEVFYAVNDIIRPVYLADAAIQAFFVLGLISALRRSPRVRLSRVTARRIVGVR